MYKLIATIIIIIAITWSSLTNEMFVQYFRKLQLKHVRYVYMYIRTEGKCIYQFKTGSKQVHKD